MVHYNIATHFVGSEGLQGFAESTTVRQSFMKHCIKSAKQSQGNKFIQHGHKVDLLYMYW